MRLFSGGADMGLDGKVTRKCRYRDSCAFPDTADCVNIINGCLKKYLNKEEAENPLKSRH